MASDFRLSPNRRDRIVKALRYATRPQIMGILNTTNDSFYADSRTMNQEAVARGTAMIMPVQVGWTSAENRHGPAPNR